METKWVISVPVHERPEIVRDQLQNFWKFTNGAIVVIHVSESSGDDLFKEITAIVRSDFPNFALVNPRRVWTALGWNLGKAHLINFEHARAMIGDFDIFSTTASNCMFVRHGVENLFTHDFGLFFFDEIGPHCQEQQMRLPAHKSIVEGAFYRASEMDRIAAYINANYSDHEIRQIFCGEEFLFQTVAWHLCPDILGRNASSYVKLQPMVYWDQFVDVIEHIRNGIDHRTQPRLDKIQPAWCLYAYKPVHRDMNDPVRRYIATL